MPEGITEPEAEKFKPVTAVELVDYQLVLVRGSRYDADRILRYLQPDDNFGLQLLDLEAYVDASGLLHLRLDYTSHYPGADTRTDSCVMTYSGQFTVWWDS